MACSSVNAVFMVTSRAHPQARPAVAASDWMDFTEGWHVEYAQREVHGPLAEAVRELWFLRGRGRRDSSASSR